MNTTPDGNLSNNVPQDSDDYKGASCMRCFWFLSFGRHGKCRALPPASTHSLSALCKKLDDGDMEIILARHLVQPTVSPENKCSMFFSKASVREP
jgi:hypothetical protein